MMIIDGSMGEGGGQIVRTSLALSIITQTPIQISRLRAGRARPGLMRQHLAALLAAAEISGAEVTGAELGSQEVSFKPGPVIPGAHRFAVGTAGSATLVLQTILPPLLRAERPSSLVLEGGTHNPTAPPFEFIDKTFLPLLQRIGAPVSAVLYRPGFYPAGGGRFEVKVEPAPKLGRLTLLERGQLLGRRAVATVSELPDAVAERELAVIIRTLGLAREDCRSETLHAGFGPGNVVRIELEYEQVTEVVTAFGKKGLRAETVAQLACQEVLRYLESDTPVGPHLADQLLLPMALGGGGSFLTMPLSAHATTQIELIGQFLSVPITATPRSESQTLVEVGGPA